MSARAVFLASLILLCSATPAGAAEGWQWPLRGDVITRFHNGTDPYAGGQHRGVDIAGAEGSEVVAATAGTVRFAGPLGSSGLTVSVRTADGRLDTTYLHLSAVSVHKGGKLSAGDRIGGVGTTGRRSAAPPHLHFGVREAADKHAYRDPLDFLPPLVPAPREAPRSAPAPVPVPMPFAISPEPVRSPGRVRVPATRPIAAPQPRRVPAARRVRLPDLGRAPRALPHPVAVPVPVAVRPLVRTRSLRPVSRLESRARGSAPARAPQVGPAPERLPAARSVHAAAADPAPRHAPQPAGGGPDIGLALACLGLLLAAACLGRPGSRGEGGKRRRSFDHLTAWLGPLLGRR